MNIYVRYFNNEAITHNFDELLAFLESLQEINVNDQLIEELATYCESDMPYPKRCKVRTRVYFILIKTNAETMEEFKANRRTPQQEEMPYPPDETQRKDTRLNTLQGKQEGWYLARINFKRMQLTPGTQKSHYHDTTFSAYVFATSPMHCYNRIIEHLKGRQDVDERSQYPSVKGNNFIYDFLGATIEETKK